MQKKKINERTISNYIILQPINIMVYLIIFVIASIIAVFSDIGKENIFYISLVYLGISSFISGLIAGLKERKNGMVCGALNALPMIVFVCIASIISNKFSISYNTIISALTAVIAAAAGGVIAVNIRLR